MLRSINVFESYTLHCTKKWATQSAAQGLTGSQRGRGGLGLLGLAGCLRRYSHGAFDPVTDCPESRKKGLRPQLTASGEVGGEIIIWGRFHNIFSGWANSVFVLLD